jgi:hypothetical protein
MRLLRQGMRPEIMAEAVIAGQQEIVNNTYNTTNTYPTTNNTMTVSRQGVSTGSISTLSYSTTHGSSILGIFLSGMTGTDVYDSSTHNGQLPTSSYGLRMFSGSVSLSGTGYNFNVAITISGNTVRFVAPTTPSTHSYKITSITYDVLYV